jgi:hypothetical protein
MKVRGYLALALVPLLLAGCSGGECNDVGAPSGVRLLTDEYVSPPRGATVEVCAGESCGSVALAETDGFLDLSLPADTDVELVVVVRDAAALAVARSVLSGRASRVTTEGACDSGGPQLMLKLDPSGKARVAE